MGEFDLIREFFTRPTSRAVVGVGDDCAVLQPAAGMQLAISTDMLVAGRHFFEDTDPRNLGHKSLAVNLSDLAACGARPVAFTLALALPQANPAWLRPFAQGMLELADLHACELIGGDTTQGPLNICITVFGEVPVSHKGTEGRVPTGTQALLRSGARAGDDIWVSGTLGDANLALRALQGSLTLPADALAKARLRLECPAPRVALGLALRGIASAAADISDGLLGDLGHILDMSQVGATVSTHVVRQMVAIGQYSMAGGGSDLNIDDQTLLASALSGGDDYELVFTAAPQNRAAVQAAALQVAVPLTRIGHIEKLPGLRLVDAQGAAVANTFTSFDHFDGA